MRAVIFDFDGTLADSFTAVIDIAHRLTKREQLADPGHVKAMRDQNMGLRQAIRSLRIPRWQWPWLLRRGRRLMSHEIHFIPLFPGMAEVLAKLNTEKIELFIISSNSRANVNRFLSEKGISSYFKKVYGGVALFDKARVIKRVLKDNRLSIKSTLYIGDEVRDVEAAKQLDLPMVAVTWGYNSEALLLNHSPTIMAHNPKQLDKIILGWAD